MMEVFVIIFSISIFITLLVVLTQIKNTSKPQNEEKHWCEDLRKGLKDSKTAPSGKVYDWKLKETWEDYPCPNYDDVHTYCQVAFDQSEKYFYYRTRNPHLRVGDKVYVPVGYKYEKKVGTIISMKNYVGTKAPYPLEKTKHIIGKVE